MLCCEAYSFYIDPLQHCNVILTMHAVHTISCCIKKTISVYFRFSETRILSLLCDIRASFQKMATHAARKECGDLEIVQVTTMDTLYDLEAFIAEHAKNRKRMVS